MFERPLWTSDEIQKATGGEVLWPFSAHSVVIDSREVSVANDAFFVALQGPKFDGHDYVAQALKEGAVGVLVSRIPEGVDPDAPLVLVDDVLQALNDMAAFARSRTVARVIGVTGSFGKTSLKEALRHVLETQGATLATERSFNNHWGLPLTLARLHAEHEFAVIEMGMNNPGEILSHSKLARPHIAIITNTGDAHIGKLGSVADIAKAKAEIFDGVEVGGHVILWAQDGAYVDHKERVQAKNLALTTFGSPGDFSAKTSLAAEGLKITVTHGGGAHSLIMGTVSPHWGLNVASVAACAHCLNLNWQQIIAPLETLSLPPGRGTIFKTPAGLTILDESYNAAPTTMASALQALVSFGEIAGARTVAILGDMLEVGPESAAVHAALAQGKGVESVAKIHCCGPEMKHLHGALPSLQQGAWAENPQDLMDTILDDVRPGDVYLIKGSRGQWAARGRMAVFVEAIQNYTFSTQKKAT